MKIFGKRSSKNRSSSSSSSSSSKSSLDNETSPPNTTNEKDESDKNIVKSYFSPNFRPASFISEKIDASDKKSSGNSQSGNSRKGETTATATASHDMETLLAMNPEELNAKQRRLVRRHRERTGVRDEEEKAHRENVDVDDAKNRDENAEDEEPFDAPSCSCRNGQSEEIQQRLVSKQGRTCESRSEDITDAVGVENTERSGGEAGDSSTPLLSQLEGLNSKERRKLLRRLRRESGGNSGVEAGEGSDGKNDAPPESETVLDNLGEKEAPGGMTDVSNILAVAEEEARRIAEYNRSLERERHEQRKHERKRKRVEAENGEDGTRTRIDDDEEDGDKGQSDESPRAMSETEVVTSNKKKRKRSKRSHERDLSHIPPEERLRRDEQRRLQKEAALRRANGEANTHGRHPLNSERRRANRRKPPGGRAGRKKKETAEYDDRANFNAAGYLMRKDKQLTGGGE